MLHHDPWNHQAAAEQSDLYDLLAFLVFVQVRDVCSLIRAHCFGADEVANGFLLAVDLAERAIHILLPVDLITVDLSHKKNKKKSHSAQPLSRRCFALSGELTKPNHVFWHSPLQRRRAYRV